MKKYKLPLIGICSLIGLTLLRELGLLSSLILTWPMLLICTILLTLIIFYCDRCCTDNVNKQTFHFENLDFMRYICAIFIILVHLRPFVGNMDLLDIFFNNIIGRLSVPLYFFVTGYFAAIKGKKDELYIKKFIKSMMPLYIGWSLVYVPFAIIWLQEYFPYAVDFINAMNLPSFINMLIYILMIPLALAVGFLYIGTYYHLWYFPALFFSLWIVDKLRKHVHFFIILIVTLGLLLLGATETYYGVLPAKVTYYLDFYFTAFVTTRNFLFFGLFYVAFGYFVGQKNQLYVKHSFIKLCLCIFLLFIEAYFLLPTNRLNSNIMLSCIPLVYYLFHTLIQLNTIYPLPMKHSFREYYKYYYLLHPMMIVFVQLILYDMLYVLTAWIQFLDLVLVITLTHLGTLFMFRLKKKYLKCVL